MAFHNSGLITILNGQKQPDSQGNTDMLTHKHPVVDMMGLVRTGYILYPNLLWYF